MKSSKKACKIFAESKLLSAVTGLKRDENLHFSIFKYLTINKLIFQKRHWKVPYFPQKQKQCGKRCFFSYINLLASRKKSNFSVSLSPVFQNKPYVQRKENLQNIEGNQTADCRIKRH